MSRHPPGRLPGRHVPDGDGLFHDVGRERALAAAGADDIVHERFTQWVLPDGLCYGRRVLKSADHFAACMSPPGRQHILGRFECRAMSAVTRFAVAGARMRR